MATPYVPFALGALAGAVLAIAVPVISRSSQPALKEAIKAALILARQAQVKSVEFMEMLEDTYAEARLEAQAAMAAPAAAPRRRAAAEAPARKRAAPPKAKVTARKAVRRVTRRAASEAAANA